MMRTDEEIVARIQAIEKAERDWLGFERQELVWRLAFDVAKPFFKADASPEDWGEPEPRDRATVVEEMRKYMEFGWEKAINHRGISASRTIARMMAWLWLLEDDDLLGFATDGANYGPYGAPVLKRICEKYEFPVPEGEVAERMGNGQPCRDGCDEGCMS